MMDEQAYNEEVIKGFETDAASRVADREKQEAHDKEIQQRKLSTLAMQEADLVNLED